MCLHPFHPGTTLGPSLTGPLLLAPPAKGLHQAATVVVIGGHPDIPVSLPASILPHYGPISVPHTVRSW